jgi:AAA family ATP:ADP antiporter
VSETNTSAGPLEPATEPHGAVYHPLRRVIEVRPDELAMLGWSWLYFFCVLSAYYVIRPIRDDMGVAGGVENLPWLFTGSLAGMLLTNPPFAFLVSRLPRLRFVTIWTRFFTANLVMFFVLLQLSSGSQQIWAGRIFFVWTSVFNMFVVSLFWSVMTDVYSAGQAKRLFGFIGAGGTIGSMAGAGLTAGMVGQIGSTNLLLVSAAILELGVFAVRRLLRASEARGEQPLSIGQGIIGGRIWEGLTRALRTPYFLHVTLHMLLFTVLTTFLYFQQATIVDAALTDRAVRTAFFARIDLLVNVVVLLTQVFVTGRFVKASGIAVSLAFLPALSVVGFFVLGLVPTIAVLMAFQVLRRAGNFAIARPAREVLFTVVSREDRYKAKSFIDTVIYRAGDQIGAWSYALLGFAGLGIPGISVVAIALSFASIGNAVWLGRRQERMMHDQGKDPAAPEVPAAFAITGD